MDLSLMFLWTECRSCRIPLFLNSYWKWWYLIFKIWVKCSIYLSVLVNVEKKYLFSKLWTDLSAVKMIFLSRTEEHGMNCLSISCLLRIPGHHILSLTLVVMQGMMGDQRMLMRCMTCSLVCDHKQRGSVTCCLVLLVNKAWYPQLYWGMRGLATG